MKRWCGEAMEAFIFYIIGAVLLSFILYIVIRNAINNSILKDVQKELEDIKAQLQSKNN
ncbi:MAG TPA: hypothetical protein VIG43_01915 [Kurthia sp.]